MNYWNAYETNHWDIAHALLKVSFQSASNIYLDITKKTVSH